MPVLRRCVVTLAAVAGLSSAADSGEAATIDLSWDVCSPFVLEKNPSAPGALGFVVSVKGKNEPHQTYEFWIEGTLADAW